MKFYLRLFEMGIYFSKLNFLLFHLVSVPGNRGNILSASDSSAMEKGKKILYVVRVLAVAVMSQLYLALGLAGAHYIYEGRCQLIEIPVFLTIAAFINFTFQPWRAAKRALLQNPLMMADIAIRPSTNTLGVNLSLVICGSIVVFGDYSTWDYHDTSARTYCEILPFVLAFAMVIHQWLLVAIFVVELVGFYVWAFWIFQQILMLQCTD